MGLADSRPDAQHGAVRSPEGVRACPYLPHAVGALLQMLGTCQRLLCVVELFLHIEIFEHHRCSYQYACAQEQPAKQRGIRPARHEIQRESRRRGTEH